MVVLRLGMMGSFPPPHPVFHIRKEIKRTMSLYFKGEYFKIRASMDNLSFFTGDIHTASWKGIKKPHVVDLGLDLQPPVPHLMFSVKTGF